MGYLSVPRVNFLGNFSVSTPTGNNADIVANLDPATPAIINNQNMTDEEIRNWLRQAKSVPDPSGNSNHVFINGGWNYFGDNSVIFENTAVKSAQLTDGTLLSDDNSQDPLLGATVELLGHKFGDQPTSAVMVDLDPTAPYTAQIYSGEFRITGKDKTGQPLVLLSGTQPGVAYCYWVYGPRNLCGQGFNQAAACWQFAISQQNLTFTPAINSPALQVLQQAAQQGSGLVIRYCMYHPIQTLSNQDLLAAFAQGDYKQNPAYGQVAGTVGVWQADELKSFPVGRMLLSSNLAEFEFQCPDHKKVTPELRGNTQTPKPAPDPVKPKKFPLGPALAQVDAARQVITLDFVTTFPETDSSLNKVDLGPLSLWLKQDGKLSQKLGPIPPEAYDQAAYEKTAGLVEIPWPPAVSASDLAQGQWVLIQDLNQVSLLEEVDQLMVGSDDQCIYTQVGENLNIELYVWSKERRQQDISLSLEQYTNTILSPGADAVFSAGKETSSGQGRLPHKEILQISSPLDYIVQMPSSITVKPDDSIVQVLMTAQAPGIAMIRFVPPEQQGQAVNWAYDFALKIRVLPEDDFDSIPAEELTWDFIYQHVFRYYHLLYPAMTNRFPLNDEKQVTARATIIKRLVSEAALESTLYMPITRELSAGKRKLVMRWASLQE